MGVNGVSLNKKQKELYKYLKFEDKNNDGKISNNGQEGYLSGADLNNDGELVHAEVLYLAHFVRDDVSKEIRDANPLTEKDKKQIETLIMEGLKKAEAGNDPKIKSSEMANIAEKMSLVGLKGKSEEVFFNSLEIAMKTEEDWLDNKSHAILSICRAVSKTIIDREGKYKLFQKALEYFKSLQITDYMRSLAISDIASLTAKEGMLQQALEMTQFIINYNCYIEALANIAYEAGKRGHNKESENIYFQAAQRAINSNHISIENKPDALSYIAKQMFLSGKYDEGNKTLSLAIETAENSQYTYDKVEGICDIAINISETDLKKEARDLFYKAEGIANNIKEDQGKLDNALECVAKKMAKAGLFRDAIAIAKKIKFDWGKQNAIDEIVGRMNSQNVKKEEAEAILQEALKTSEEIAAAEYRATAIANVGTRLHFLVSKKEAEKVFQKALSTTNHIQDTRLRSMILSDIALQNYYAGKKEGSKNIFKRSIKVAASIQYLKSKSDAFSFIAMKMYWADLKEESDVLFMIAIKTAEKIEDPQEKKDAFSFIEDKMPGPPFDDKKKKQYFKKAETFFPSGIGNEIDIGELVFRHGELPKKQ